MGGARLGETGASVYVSGLTQTHGQWFAPGSIGLAHRGLVSLNGHVGEAAKDDGGAESRALVDVFQPPIR